MVWWIVGTAVGFVVGLNLLWLWMDKSPMGFWGRNLIWIPFLFLGGTVYCAMNALAVLMHMDIASM